MFQISYSLLFIFICCLNFMLIEITSQELNKQTSYISNYSGQQEKKNYVGENSQFMKKLAKVYNLIDVYCPIQTNNPQKLKNVNKNKPEQISAKEYRMKGKPKSPLPQIKMSYPQYIEKFARKEYSIYKHEIYLQNLKKINQNNADPYRVSDLDLNQFTDIDPKEFTNQYAFKNQKIVRIVMSTQHMTSTAQKQYDEVTGLQIFYGPRTPQSNFINSLKKLNISMLKYAGPIHNQQQQCKSCYAFAVLDTIWIKNNIRNVKILKQKVQSPFFSLFQILRCASQIQSYEILGCNGGSIISVFNYILDFGISYQQQEYEYYNFLRGRSNRQCKENTRSQISKKYKIKDFRATVGCPSLILALNASNPVAVIIPFTSKLQLYKGYGPAPYEEVITNQTNYHSVVIIGFNSQDGYLFKNTWGTTWGMDGTGYLISLSRVCDLGYYPVLFDQQKK